ERVPVRNRAGRSRRRSRATLGAVAAAAAGAVVVVPLVLGGGSAYAGWTAIPSPLPAGEESEAAEQCREWNRQVATTEATGATSRVTPGLSVEAVDEARVVVSEQRGEHAFVVL